MIDPGRMRQRLVYEEEVESGVDPHGRPITAWTPRFELWAAVEPLSARKAYYAQQTKALRTHDVHCRFRPGFSIGGRLRFKGTNRSLRIESILNVDEAGVELWIGAIEEVTPTSA